MPIKAKSTNTPATTGTSFGELIRAYRRARGIGLVDLAHTVGMDPALLSRVETTKRLPPDDMRMVRRLADAVGIEADSEEYRDLLARSFRDRIRATSEDEFTTLVKALAQPMEPMPPTTPTFCKTLAELLARSIECAVNTKAEAITVRGEDGATHKFQLSDGGDALLRLTRSLRARRKPR